MQINRPDGSGDDHGSSAQEDRRKHNATTSDKMEGQEVFAGDSRSGTADPMNDELLILTNFRPSWR